ncbi:MAG: phytanoyl-CoA dioxygenase family protein, partial [Ginsengibacter sp.]
MMEHFQLTPQLINQYQQDGYIIVKNFLSPKETDKLYSIAIADDMMKKHAYDLNDQSGKKTKLSLWYKPGNDTYGLLTRSRRIVEAVSKL